jgi:hypothetical protein
VLGQEPTLKVAQGLLRDQAGKSSQGQARRVWNIRQKKKFYNIDDCCQCLKPFSFVSPSKERIAKLARDAFLPGPMFDVQA